MLRELGKERFSGTRAIKRRFLFARSRLSSMRDIAFLVLVASVGFLFGTQGWNSHIPAFDMITYFENARNFLLTGAPPQYGDVGSYGSFKAPGTAWFMVPGMLVFKDPRLYEFPGSAILHFGTLLGVYLLSKTYFGRRCAYLAVLIYGLSNLGFWFAGSLWPIGHPFFYVWIVYLGSLWVTRREAKYLAAAVMIWTIGMNLNISLLPAIFILPVLWLMYRPPLHWQPLVVALTLSLIIWFPYLQFNAGRDFADIRSQLLLQKILPANYRDAWCDPNLTFLNWGSLASTPVMASTDPQASPSKILHFFGRLLLRGNTIIEGMLTNFTETTSVPAISFPLLLLVLGSIFVVGLAGISEQAFNWILHTRLWRDWLTPFAIGLIVLGLLANEMIISLLLPNYGGLPQATLLSIRRFQVMFVLVGIVLLVRDQIVTFLREPAVLDISSESVTGPVFQARMIAISLLMPWFILLLVAEPGRPERFFWLWPLQALFLAVFAVKIFPQIHAPAAANWIFQGVLLLALIGIPVFSKLEIWHQMGWAGPKAEEMLVTDFIAEQIDSEAKDQAAIGYQVFFYPFMVSYHMINPIYKVGAEFDLLFKFHYGITNTDQCAEGFSPSDEYLIVQTQPQEGIGTPRLYFDVPPDANFKLMRQFGTYQVFKRQ